MHYGPAFRTVVAPGHLRAQNDALDRRHLFDPALLDGALQTLLPSDTLLAGPRVPVAIESIVIDADALTGELFVETHGDELAVANERGEVAIRARGIRLADLERPRAGLYTLEWRESEPAGRHENALRWIAPRIDDPVAAVDELLSFARSAETQRLVVVTRGAFAVGDERVDPVHAAIAAAARTLAHEHPELAPISIDLPHGASDADLQLLDEHEASQELELAIRNGRAYAPRLVPSREAPAKTESAGRFVATTARPGALDRIVLRATRAKALAAGEVEVEVRATGLNFLNALSALGEYPGYPDGFKTLGVELSGIVTRTGADVIDVQPGDAVLGLADDALATHVVTKAALLVPKPASLSFEHAAAIPAAYLTAAFALREVARVQPGERVLIHAAAGGVGQAAIHIARAAGAEVLATAGTDAKRELVRALGVAHVFDSRSTEFAREAGSVDVVLGAVTGAVRAASLSILAPFGRYLDIGKRGASEALRQPAPNVSIHTIDLDALAQQRPRVLQSLLARIIEEVIGGTLPPPDVQTFDATQIHDAFALLARGAHTGKLVVVPRNATNVEPEQGIGPLLEENATYLVTGGTGAIGSAIAARLTERGACHVVLASRGAGSGDVARRIGANVREIACDVSDASDCARLLQTIERELPPLRGIVHCAGTLADAAIANQTRESIARVFTKSLGAANLVRRDAWFIAISSAAALFGPPGQANYAAANAHLDALVHEWRRGGMRAVTIDYGPVAEAGLAAARKADLGVRPLHLAEVVDVFERALAEDQPRLVAIGEWGETDDPLLHELSAREESKQATLAAMLAAIDDPGARVQFLEQQLIAHAAAVLRARATDLDRDTPFKQLGVDSLMALQLKNRLRDSLGVTVPVTSFWAHPTIAAYTAYLADLVAGPRRIEVKRAAPTADEILEMSDEEAERLLMEKVQ